MTSHNKKLGGGHRVAIYRRADPRFIYRAADHAAHKGYQKWHRLVDQTVVKWLRENPSATPEKFTKFLNRLYAEPWVAERIPYVEIVL